MERLEASKTIQNWPDWRAMAAAIIRKVKESQGCLELLNLRIHNHGHVIQGSGSWYAVTTQILELRVWLQHLLIFLTEDQPWAQTLWEVTLSS